jgi:hypothetical protein
VENMLENLEQSQILSVRSINGVPVTNIGLFSFFFILPRYNLSLLTVQIIFNLYFIEKKIIKYKNIKK